jgi:sporulation protein YlmC with PRC-barrel domain
MRKGNIIATMEKGYELDNRTGENHEGVDANTPVRRLTAASLIGDEIENPEGESLGKIDDLMISLRNGAVEFAIIEFGSVLGMGGKLFAVPFHELRLDPARKIFILKRDKEYLKQSPGFDKTHWPDTNDHSYFENVTMYYGSYLPPFP